MEATTTWRDAKRYLWVLGLTASLVLSIDAVVLAADPNAALSCNLTETISCAKVGVSW